MRVEQVRIKYKPAFHCSGCHREALGQSSELVMGEWSPRAAEKEMGRFRPHLMPVGWASSHMEHGVAVKCPECVKDKGDVRKVAAG